MKSANRDRYLEQGFMRPDAANHAPGTGPAARLDRREADRVAVSCHVSYVSEEGGFFQGKGQVLNVSKQGCRIVGPILAVGSVITISVNLQEGKPSLNIAGATVCWEDGYSFGVKFPAIRGEDRQRLQELVLKLATRRGSSQEHAAFRLA
jgi:hypothetical protein